jgi:hypothetical protein
MDQCHVEANERTIVDGFGNGQFRGHRKNNPFSNLQVKVIILLLDVSTCNHTIPHRRGDRYALAYVHYLCGSLRELTVSNIRNRVRRVYFPSTFRRGSYKVSGLFLKL